MQRIEQDIHQCRALVVEGNVLSRSILCAQLRDFGIGTVAQAGRVRDARQLLESRPFDIVLCEVSFPDGGSGQELLDELRRANLLPFSTVFIMITAEASYARVSEAAESASDGYLLKPHTATGLAQRIVEARRRKRELMHVFAAIEKGDHAAAAALCHQRFEQRAPYWLYAARIGAELFLRLEEPRRAQALYRAVVDAKALPWARLGIARSDASAGDLAKARATLNTLLDEMPAYTDSYDVMGRVLVEQGEIREACDVYCKAAELSPGSVTRLVHAGTLAFYAGRHGEAAKALERACMLGASSKLLDEGALLLLALLQCDADDAKALQRTQSTFHKRRLRQPDCPRLARLDAVIETVCHLQGRRLQEAICGVRALSQEVDHEMDMESACAAIGLWARLHRREVQLDDMASAVGRIARRFSISRATTELLVAAAHGSEAPAEVIRASHAEILSDAERAMDRALRGSPAEAVAYLLDRAADTRNAKLIDLAGMVTRRHRERIPDAPALEARTQALVARYAPARALALGAAQGGRAAGGVRLPG